ncbi:cysteine-tryptophan domain-containing zinc finger protein 3-like isoform X2 [Hibiscus syriacus]|uniref:cysteine-tryptophan domain-containing zinc finger protein 3-like isoform X2 n=1 Tax=Hibiscus syriacus TaxID=106335 RepID=UPI001921929F|nr:cysteine-tryptophan domain-containing zinc finger protein 3-like isoform X2 [Hibiscus syriacus]
MISLGCNDARKGLGLGYGEREMEESELEEGEACTYKDEYDGTTGPENDLSSLSYIDEKIQHVLGHFQKDFEGGVSAENLGAKFGGYGSFLPTCPRSPVWSNKKSLPKVKSCNAIRSPNEIQVEDGRHPTKFGTLPALKASSANDLIKQEVSITSTHAHDLGSRCKYADKKAANLPKKKTLKLRIKVGSDNLLTQKNAAIYSGLGLDVSPSSSLDECPSESEGMYQETQEPLFESPTHIIQLITSFPVPGETLLSPLPDHLLSLIVKEKASKENRSKGKGNQILSGDEKADSVEKKAFTVERKGDNKREIRNDNGIMSKNELDTDTLACKEFVSKPLPLLLNSHSAVDKVKDKSIAGNKGVHYVAMEESVEPILAQNIRGDNLRANSAQKVLNDNSGCARKNEYIKAENTCDFLKAESNSLKSSKALESEPADPLRKKSSQRATLHDQDNMKLPPAKDHTSSGGKNKSKGNHGQGSLAAEVPKESSRLAFLMPKVKKTAHVNNNTNKRDSGEQKLDIVLQKAEDWYREFFGDVGGGEQEEYQTRTLEIHSKGRMKEDDKIGKNTLAINIALNDRRIGKKSEDLLVSKSYPGATVNGASNSGNVNAAGACLGAAPPVLIKENWVSCDQCMKWRLLPISIKPTDLPEKWSCSMLNWLPAMNHCSVDEEETTKAVFALYQVPSVASQNNLQNNPGSTMSRLQSADTLKPEQNQQFFGSHAMPPGRKKHGSKEISNAIDKDGPVPMKNIQASVLSGSSTDITKSPVVSELGLLDPRKCDLPAKKHKSKKKEKHKVSEHISGGGDSKTSKMKRKRTSDQESLRASKKIKSEILHLAGEDCMSEHAGKGVPSTINDLPTTLIGKDQPKHCERSSDNDQKLDKEDKHQDSGKRPKEKVQVSLADGSIDMMNFDGGDVSRKRKVDDDGRVFVKEEFSKNDYRQEKKAKASVSGGSPSRYSDGEDMGQSDKSGIRKGKTSLAAQHWSLDSSILDVQDKDDDQASGSRAKASIESSSNIREGQFMNGNVDYLGQEAKSVGELTTMDKHHGVENQNEKHGDGNVSQTRKLGKGSAQSKDRRHKLKSDSVDELEDSVPSRSIKPRDKRKNFKERLGVKSIESENRFVDDNKASAGKLSGESSKRESQSNVACSDAKQDAIGGQDVISSVKQNIVQDGNASKYMKRSNSDKSDHAEIASGRGNSLSLPPSGGTPKEMLTHCLRPTGSQKGTGANGYQDDDALKKVQIKIKKAGHQNGTQHGSSRHSTSGGHRIRDIDAPSPMRKDSCSQAATKALKEAKDLKHMADRVKNSGSNEESTALYFQSALKFLHSASLLESCNSEGTKQGEMIQSLQIYSSTTKLCEFCAHEYERLNDMAAASLAYKCAEVAYMRVIYTSHANTSRDRRELQTALQMVPPGESPFSSAFDVDNLNHPMTADKVVFPKGVSSPQVAGNHVVSARNRPNFVRFLNFAQDVNHAMEASRKSRIAFAHAKSSLSGDDNGEVIYSLKKALDFNFLDIEGLLRLIRVAMEAISH